MRSLEETQSRWHATRRHGDLQRAVRANGPSSPCLSGCRSVCWKTFLLSRAGSSVSWTQAVRAGREDYASLRGHFLRFIEHPAALAELTIDPLADDPESPWNTVRQDELVRAEIQQDVQRLPDEVDYHHPRIQSMILDILFVYCKANPDRGGYRQGMHELLAPIVHVMGQDAVDRSAAAQDAALDQLMLDMLDSSYIEHDAYVLFSRIMESAQAFYEVHEADAVPDAAQPDAGYHEQRSAIVERSKFIHEVCLQQVDQELASHLTSIEILPQIFLIRWIRLLFSREFPLDQYLVLWDTIFAVDASLDLIDLICCAMLIRIRWQLLEADYSVCLQLLLKYPPPAPAHGPHTFVDDAFYLRDHMNASGGMALIMKHTGRMPGMSTPTHDAQLGAADSPRLDSLRQGGFGTRSPLPSPSRFIPQQGGVESLFHGAAKGVLERGEKLGINQAVREAVVEIRRNMQSFNETRHSPMPSKCAVGEEGAAKALAAMERRNRQLASLLGETVANLKTVCASASDDKGKSLETIEVAAAKVQFVQVYLGDSSMEVPSFDDGAPAEAKTGASEDSPREESSTDGVEASAAAQLTPSPTVDDDVSKVSLADGKPPPLRADSTQEARAADGNTGLPPRHDDPAPLRPAAPIPARSTLAQSSFSWMLEPDETSSARALPSTSSKTPPTQHKKRPSSNASRGRNAFLFGETAAETNGRAPAAAEDVFGLEPIQKPNNG